MTAGKTDLEVVVFVDWQNLLGDARRAFGGLPPLDPWFGQVDPSALGRLLCGRPAPAESGSRTLKEVRVYRGRPDATREPRTYAAHMRQCSAWEKAGVKLVTRQLRYPRDWPRSRAEEKGIDVALAIDFTLAALNRDFDVGIIASTDTDLRPALEAVFRFPAEIPRPRVEVTTWWSPVQTKQLRVAGERVWCHRLEEKDYWVVADTRDYNLR